MLTKYHRWTRPFSRVAVTSSVRPWTKARERSERKKVDRTTGNYAVETQDCPAHWFHEQFRRRVSAQCDSAYGDVPRRISSDFALSLTGEVAMMSMFATSAPSPENENDRFNGEPWQHIPESENTLYVGAWQIGELTWISSPPRALLDSAQLVCHYRTPEWLLGAMMRTNYSSEQILSIAIQADMMDGVRRLAAIGELMEEYRKGISPAWVRGLLQIKASVTRNSEAVCFTRPWIYEIQAFAAEHANGIIPMLPGRALDLGSGEVDEKYGVLWNVGREETLNEHFVF